MGDYRDLVLSTLERELIGNAAHTRRYNLFIDAIQKDVLFGTKVKLFGDVLSNGCTECKNDNSTFSIFSL